MSGLTHKQLRHPYGSNMTDTVSINAEKLFRLHDILRAIDEIRAMGLEPPKPIELTPDQWERLKKDLRWTNMTHDPSLDPSAGLFLKGCEIVVKDS